MKIGIRREDKSPWEARIPLVPKHIKYLLEQGINILVQPSKQRIFSDEELQEAGATIAEDLNECKVIMGVKEIPLELLNADTTYIFFSHTIKGQLQNMPLLKRLQDLRCSLIDYERIVDENGRRLVSFSRFAGLAGLLDALWLYGQRQMAEGKETPLAELKQSVNYDSLEAAKHHLKEVGHWCLNHPNFEGLVLASVGVGRVGRGVVEMARYLEPKVVAPETLMNEKKVKGFYLALFDTADIIERIDGKEVDPIEYRNSPELYRGVFSRYLPYIDIVANGIYWEEPYPRLITKKELQNVWDSNIQRPKVIGDISCDVKGSVEFTERTCDPGDPYYLYNVPSGELMSSLTGNGPILMANEILPTEFPRESSLAFSDALLRFIPALVATDDQAKRWNLPPELDAAVILHNGELRPDYSYLSTFISRLES